VTRKWVVNASPLIILGKISKIDLLVNLADTLVVPKAVAKEVSQGGSNDPAKIWLAQEGSDFVRETPTLSTVIANWDLGEGESHVLNWTLAYNDYEAILDDLAARRCAKTLSIPVRGTLGVLLLAKKTGLVPEIAPLLSSLSVAGLHIAPNLLETIRRLADE
jgi:predicted nucleic acid-binding protein